MSIYIFYTVVSCVMSSQRILQLTYAHIKTGTVLYCMVFIIILVCKKQDDISDSFSHKARRWSCGLVWLSKALFYLSP